MRCDDAERDARVNHEVCRQMGIASVLVMPVVNDDQVLGVFELFSGKANAFGERDLSAVQRLSEMVETAVRMAYATENLTEQLSARESSVAEAVHPEVFEGQFLSDLVVEEVKQHPSDRVPEKAGESVAEASAKPVPPAVAAAPEKPSPLPPVEAAAQVVEAKPAKKTLFWSAALSPEAESDEPSDADQSHVPPVLRGLRKCEACGFPISGGRVLCVECEEKKWRGQLRPQSAARKPPTGIAEVRGAKSGNPSFAGAAPSLAKAPPVPAPGTAETGPKLAIVPPSAGPAKVEESEKTAAAPVEPPAVPEIAPASSQTSDFVLSAGMEPSRSWFAANKYIVLVLLVLGGVAAAFILLR